jgi:hypothetical protein
MHSQNYKLTPAPSENCFAIFLLRVRSNNDSNPDDPDESAQHRERARSSTTVNPYGQATHNSVLQTLQNSVLQTLPQLNGEFLLAFNSLNHLQQLDQIRRLDRELRDRRTSDVRHMEIAVFLRKLEVVDPVEEQEHQQQQQQRLLQHQQQLLLLSYSEFRIRQGASANDTGAATTTTTGTGRGG